MTSGEQFALSWIILSFGYSVCIWTHVGPMAAVAEFAGRLIVGIVMLGVFHGGRALVRRFPWRVRIVKVSA